MTPTCVESTTAHNVDDDDRGYKIREHRILETSLLIGIQEEGYAMSPGTAKGPIGTGSSTEEEVADDTLLMNSTCMRSVMSTDR